MLNEALVSDVVAVTLISSKYVLVSIAFNWAENNHIPDKTKLLLS